MRSVLVTGASTGIGRATALHMDGLGWRVFAGVRKEGDAESLRAAGSERLVPLTLDVTRPEQIAAAAAWIGDEVGENGLDGLVNNAGIGVMGPLETVPIEDFRRQIEVNLIGQVAVTQAMLPLIRRATGRIVLISSGGGRMALPFGGAYHAAKFGLEGVADSLRQELKPWGIEVSVIEPGSIDTPIWERSVSAFEEAAKQAPPAQEELYGKRLAGLRKGAERTAARGIPPEKVAAAIADALTARRPRTRRRVGLDAQGQILLRRLLPDRALDRLVAAFLRI